MEPFSEDIVPAMSQHAFTNFPNSPLGFWTNPSVAESADEAVWYAFSLLFEFHLANYCICNRGLFPLLLLGFVRICFQFQMLLWCNVFWEMTVWFLIRIQRHMSSTALVATKEHWCHSSWNTRLWCFTVAVFWSPIFCSLFRATHWVASIVPCLIPVCSSPCATCTDALYLSLHSPMTAAHSFPQHMRIYVDEWPCNAADRASATYQMNICRSLWNVRTVPLKRYTAWVLRAEIGFNPKWANLKSQCKFMGESG